MLSVKRLVAVGVAGLMCCFGVSGSVFADSGVDGGTSAGVYVLQGDQGKMVDADTGETFREVLQGAGVDVGKSVVNVDLDDVVTDSSIVKVQKVDVRVVEERVKIPAGSVDVDALKDCETFSDARVEVAAGVDGERLQKFRVVSVDGVQKVRNLVSDTVVKEKKDREMGKCKPPAPVNTVAEKSETVQKSAKSVKSSRSASRNAETVRNFDNLSPAIGNECKASYYWQGQMTANGERFNTNDFTAAHKSLPFNTRVKVTNKHNGRSVVVRINDRGPYIAGRCLDLSRAAMSSIGGTNAGVVPVTWEIVG